MDSLKLAKKSAEILDDKKGTEIKIIKMDDKAILSDYIVMVTGTNSTHVRALVDEVEEKLKKDGVFVNHVEGHRSNSWILLDYGNVIVHVFSEEARRFYDLDGLLKS